MVHDRYHYDDIVIVLKSKNPRIVHIQKRLRDVIPSPVEIVFRAEELLGSGDFTIENLVHGLYCGFPLYNLDDEQLQPLLNQLKDTFLKKNRLIIPKELLSLAMLNKVDCLLQGDNMAGCFKTKYFRDIPMGRRIYASRFLRENAYIVEEGHVWKRTDKEFNPEDFWVEPNNVVV